MATKDKVPLKYNDPQNWLEIVKEEVKSSYKIPIFLKKRICIDVGANYGAFPLLHHKKFDKILCIEASDYCYKKIIDNLKQNKINNVEVYNLAAYKKSNKIVKLHHFRNIENGKITSGQEMSGNASISNIQAQEGKAGFDLKNEYEEVASIDLEGVKRIAGVNKIDYLKCDIECGEYDFLMNKDLSCINFLAMELHCHLGDKKVKDLIEYLKKFFIPYKRKWPIKLPRQSKGENFHLTLNLINKNQFLAPFII